MCCLFDVPWIMPKERLILHLDTVTEIAQEYLVYHLKEISIKDAALYLKFSLAHAFQPLLMCINNF